MTSTPVRAGVWGVVPAAGVSGRMGRPKQTLPAGETTVVAAVVRTLLAAQLEAVIVVTRSELRESLQLPADPRLRIAINDRAGSEMIDSIRIGLDALDAAGGGSATTMSPVDGVMVVPGDMPGLSDKTCRRCVDVFRSDPTRIVIATNGGRRGHPIIFPLSMRSSLDGLGGGLRELPAKHADRAVSVECADGGVLEDIDTPGDYSRFVDRDRQPE